ELLRAHDLFVVLLRAAREAESLAPDETQKERRDEGNAGDTEKAHDDRLRAYYLLGRGMEANGPVPICCNAAPPGARRGRPRAGRLEHPSREGARGAFRGRGGEASRAPRPRPRRASGRHRCSAPWRAARAS